MIHTTSVRNRRTTIDLPYVVAGGKGADKLVLDTYSAQPAYCPKLTVRIVDVTYE